MIKPRALLLSLLCVPVSLVGAWIAFSLWDTDPWNLSAPSDEALIALLKAHRPAFDSVVRMVATDDNPEPWLYNYDYAKPRNRADEEKRKRFDQLVKEIGFRGEVTTAPDRSVDFTFVMAWPSGLGLGWGKGISYKPVFMLTQSTMVQSLDQARKRASGAYYRKLDENWYLFYYAKQG